MTIPDSWARFTQENIARSQRERAASERLRGEIDSCLRACANDMWNQFNTVNNSFNTRVRETTDARNKLQSHLQRVSSHIFFIFNANRLSRIFEFSANILNIEYLLKINRL